MPGLGEVFGRGGRGVFGDSLGLHHSAAVVEGYGAVVHNRLIVAVSTSPIGIKLMLLWAGSRAANTFALMLGAILQIAVLVIMICLRCPVSANRALAKMLAATVFIRKAMVLADQRIATFANLFVFRGVRIPA